MRFTAPLVTGPTYAPQLELTILDGKTHVPLWIFTQPVEGAFRKTTWKKNYSDGIAALMGQLRTLRHPANSLSQNQRAAWVFLPALPRPTTCDSPSLGKSRLEPS